jgi:hypothetical protein
MFDKTETGFISILVFAAVLAAMLFTVGRIFLSRRRKK